MRVRTRSACVVLAWGILLILAAVGSIGSSRPAQANTRIASNTSNSVQVILTSTLTSTGSGRPDILTSPAAGRLGPAKAPATARTGTETVAVADARTSARRYVVQPGDTLSGIAAALGVGGGWPALYVANRQAIGTDPNVIRPGTTLVLPGRAAQARYTVAVGDTLSGIAAALGVRGGWPALYAANRQIIGPDPNAISPGSVLALPRPVRSASAAPRPVRRPSTPRSTAPAPARSTAPTPARSPAAAPAPRPTSAPATAPAAVRPSAKPAPKATAPAGLPRWLKLVLVATGLLIAAAFLAEAILAIVRRRRRTIRPGTSPVGEPARNLGQEPATPAEESADNAGQDSGAPAEGSAARPPVRPAIGTVIRPAASSSTRPVTAPPGRPVGAPRSHPAITAPIDSTAAQPARPATARPPMASPPIDPTAVHPARPPAVRPPIDPTVARPARAVRAPDRRILLADYDRLVVTSSGPEGMVCVLRPPNADPEAILLAARLVLAQDRYEELAGHLGVAGQGRRE